MIYNDKDYNKALDAAKEYDERCELAHNEPDLLTLSRSLLAAQAHIAFLENELTEEATINGKGAQRELKLLSKIEELEKVAEAKELVIEVAKRHMENWGPFLSPQPLFAALTELEAALGGEE